MTVSPHPLDRTTIATITEHVADQPVPFNRSSRCGERREQALLLTNCAGAWEAEVSRLALGSRSFGCGRNTITAARPSRIQRPKILAIELHCPLLAAQPP